MAKQIVKSWKQLLSDSSEHTTVARTGSAEVRREEERRCEEGGGRVRGEKCRVVEEDKRERRKKFPHRDTTPSDTQSPRQSRPSESYSNSINGDPLRDDRAIPKTPPTSTLATPPSTSVCASPSARAGLEEGGRGPAVSGPPPAGQRKRKGVVCGGVISPSLCLFSASSSLHYSCPLSSCVG